MPESQSKPVENINQIITDKCPICGHKNFYSNDTTTFFNLVDGILIEYDTATDDAPIICLGCDTQFNNSNFKWS